MSYKEPVPLKEWSGIRQAFHEAPACMPYVRPESDREVFQANSSEDCLYMNILSPNVIYDSKG